MEKTTYTTTVLKASEGYMLMKTNTSIENAVITDKVYLAVLDSPDNWKEITIEEANAIKQQQEELIKQREEEELNKAEEINIE